MAAAGHKHVVLVAVTIVILLVGSATAQIPDKFENLKVLPKDISKRELVDIMRSMSTGLGVRCSHCHKESDDPAWEFDFKSDEVEAKEVARAMLKMVTAINGELIPTANMENPTRVRCITCHRGLQNPETLDNILLEKAQKDGAEAAVTSYRELRDEYYGSGSYDFSSRTLSTVAQKLAATDVDSAITITRFNVELYPDDTYAHTLMGQLLLTKGDTAAGIASLERALAIDADNRWAKQLLERARKSE